MQLRDALCALECAGQTLSTALGTLERSGLDPEQAARGRAAGECARHAAELSVRHARIALNEVEGLS